MASASCSALRTESSHILRRITAGQPTITRLLGKVSVIPLRNQTEIPDRCMGGRLEREIHPHLVESNILRAQAVPKAQEIGLHPVSGGQPGGQKLQLAPPVAEIEIQANPPSPAEARENAQGSHGKGRGNPSGASSSGKYKGRDSGGGPPSCGRCRGRGNHRVDNVSGADQVSDADPDYVENALNPADDPLHEAWIDESGCIHQVDAAAGGQNA